MSDTQKEHWQTMKQILIFVKGIEDNRIIFNDDLQCTLAKFSDSKFLDLGARCSITSYVIG